MTSLNLSGGKAASAENRFFKTKRDTIMSPVSVKSALSQEIEGHLKDQPPQHIYLLKKCLETTTSADQVNLIKQIGLSLQKSRVILYQEADLCLKVLVEIYFRAESRHMAKRAIVSTFQALPTQYHAKTAENMKQALHEDMLFARSSQNTDNMRHVVDNVMSCLESFNLGAQCIDESTAFVLQFVHIALQTFAKQLENASCPTIAAKASLNCQAAVRTLILILQKCPTVKHNFQNADNATEILRLLFDDVISLLSNEDNSLDCRCNSGMALSLFLQLHNNPLYIKMIASLVFVNSRSLMVTTKCPAVPDSSMDMLHTAAPVTKLCLAIGLLSSLETSELLLELDTGISLFFDVLLPNIVSLTKHAKEAPITVVTSRAILMWTKRAKEALEEMPNSNVLISKLKGDGDIACQLLEYVWTHWDHFIDSVRHITKDIFNNIIDLHILSSKEAPAESPFINWLLQSLLKMPRHQRGKYSALCCLVQHVGTKKLLELQPSLPDDLLKGMNDQSLFTHVSELMETLLTLHKSEVRVGLKEWEEMWVLPVMNAISQKSNSIVLEHLLSKLLKCSPGSLNFIILEIAAAGQRKTVGHLRALLIAAKIARSLNLGSAEPWVSTDTWWNELIPIDLLKLTLCHVDDDIRLDAFALLCDTSKTSEVLTPCTLDMIRAFLPYNTSNQSPAFRQKLLALVKKLIIRLNDGGHSMRRQINNMKRKDPNSEDIDSLQAQLDSYKNFGQWLLNTQFEALHPGANFPRRGLALNLIKLMHEIIGFQNEDSIFSLRDCLTFSHVQTLLECLRDTYETNKGIALSILKNLTSEQLRFEDYVRVSQLFEAALQLASRPRPTDSVTAAYLLRLLVLHTHTQSVARNTKMFSEECSLSPQDPNLRHSYSDCPAPLTLKDTPAEKHSLPSDIIYSTLDVLILQLVSELEVAQDDLLEASANGPMYGILFCIRSLLLDLDFRSISQNPCWKSFMPTLVRICLDIGDVVGPVVNNSSPEGYLPLGCDHENLEKLQEQIQNAFGIEYDTTHSKDTSTLACPSGVNRARSVTAQMLLLCGWRTMKEVSLLLGDICQRCIEIMTASQNLNTDNTSGENSINEEVQLISGQDILQIGEYFISLLAETKHRGAFEQAYVGFCKLCDALWRSSIAELNQLPQQWLQDLFELIQTGSEASTFCSTRRSAGLPFMVQALVSSEPDVRRSGCFKQAMCSLLEMALSDDSAEEVKVHGFNILRALYRDTRFGEDVTPFIASGLKAAILGFKGQTWGIRNSATLLLSALITRIFGVKRGQDELSKKNCMTAAVFFQRFPTLYQFLLEELHLGTTTFGSSVNRTKIQPSLYPVLLVLARLYPSSVEGTHTSIKLSSFVSYVIKCGHRPVMKTRVLAAKALVPLVPICNVPKMIKDLFRQLPNSYEETKVFPQNAIHGTLLQVFHLLSSIANSQSEKSDLRNEFSGMVQKKFWLASRSNPCPVTRAAFLDVIDSALALNIFIPKHPVYNEIQKLVAQDPSDQTHSHIPGQECLQATASKVAVHFHLNNCVLNSEEGDTQIVLIHEKPYTHLQNSVIKFLRHNAYEVRLVILRFLYDAVCFENPKCYRSNCETLVGINPLMEPTVPSTEWKFLTRQNHSWIKKVVKCDEVTTIILSMATSTEEHSDCLVQVCHLITLVKTALEKPWPCSSGAKMLTSFAEKMDFVLQKGACELQDDIRSALLHLTGFLISYLYDELETVKLSKSLPPPMNQTPSVNPQSIFMEWTEAFLLCCSPEQSLRVRLTATHLLMQNAHILLLDPKRCLGSSRLSVWSAAVLLLQDDEPYIKKLAANIVETCSQAASAKAFDNSSFDTTVHPALALDILVGQFVSHCGHQNQSECLTTLLDWMLHQNTPDLGTFLDEEARMFDRGQMNIYAEEIQFTKVVIKHFKSLLRKIFHVKKDGQHQANVKRKEIRRQVMARLGSQNSKGSTSSASLSQSPTLDFDTFQAMSDNFKGIMGSFKVITGQVSPLLSETQRDNPYWNTDHVYLQDVTDMIIEELFLLVQDTELISHQTPFLSLTYDQSIIRMYRLMTVVYCLCKYDCTQKNTLLRLQATMIDKFAEVQYCTNQLVTNVITDINTLCIYYDAI